MFHHAVPRTVCEGDMALYIALTGDRRPLHCAREFAQSLGFEREVVHDLLVFHMVFGRAVPDVSLNSPANLGYADVRFLHTVYPGDTLRAETEVIGKRETSRTDVGIVWVHTKGFNQRDEPVLQFYRWAMVNKRDPETSDRRRRRAGAAAAGRASRTCTCRRSWTCRGSTRWRRAAASSGRTTSRASASCTRRGITMEDAEHQMATRLYQNNARVHFNDVLQKKSKLGRRIVYGGHIISLCHAISYDGLENAIRILGFNAGAHANPTVAGDTLFAWTDVLERIDLGRDGRGRAAAAAGRREEPRPERGADRAEGEGRGVRPRAPPPERGAGPGLHGADAEAAVGASMRRHT